MKTKWQKIRIYSKALASILVLGMSVSTYAGDTAHAQVSCADNPAGVRLLVNVTKIRTDEGNIRVQLYGSNPEDFLAKGKKLVRVEVPSTLEESLVCVELPFVGRYAMVVMHDRNGNGKADFFTEGFGFSRNPSLGLGAPDFDEVVFDAQDGMTKLQVNLKYLWNQDEEKVDRRRKMRRR